jgi:hypothetical protein
MVELLRDTGGKGYIADEFGDLDGFSSPIAEVRHHGWPGMDGRWWCRAQVGSGGRRHMVPPAPLTLDRVSGASGPAPRAIIGSRSRIQPQPSPAQPPSRDEMAVREMHTDSMARSRRRDGLQGLPNLIGGGLGEKRTQERTKQSQFD